MLPLDQMAGSEKSHALKLQETQSNELSAVEAFKKLKFLIKCEFFLVKCCMLYPLCLRRWPTNL